MPHYKLTYFELRARGEPIRWLFAVAKQPYEDVRISFAEWPKLKPAAAFGQLPSLDVDGQTIFQSHAILHYLGLEFGLAGKTTLDQARANMIALSVEDSLNKHVTEIVGKLDADKQKEAVQKYTSETLPFHLSKYEELLGSNQYFVGNQLTYADVAIVHFFDAIHDSFGFPVDLTKYPGLAALKARVEANEGLAQWLASRPPRPEQCLVDQITALVRYRMQAAAAAAAPAAS